MQQFEELMDAAARLSPASRPLPAYYALAQAGKAIVAAHSQNSVPRSHGLSLAEPRAQRDLMSSQLDAVGDGWYQAVSDAVESPTLKKVELGMLWAANPDLAYTPLPSAHWPKAARVFPVEGQFTWAPSPTALADVVLEPEPTTPQDAASQLKAYPTAGRLVVATVPGSDNSALITRETGRGKAIRVYFSLPPGVEHLPQPTIIESRAPEYRFRDSRWLIPALDDGRVVAPLMLWWALLFALSMLARYHPEAWVAALDVNESPLAVPLEDALELAQSAVPHLVLEALVRKPVRSV